MATRATLAFLCRQHDPTLRACVTEDASARVLRVGVVLARAVIFGGRWVVIGRSLIGAPQDRSRRIRATAVILRRRWTFSAAGPCTPERCCSHPFVGSRWVVMSIEFNHRDGVGWNRKVPLSIKPEPKRTVSLASKPPPV